VPRNGLVLLHKSNINSKLRNGHVTAIVGLAADGLGDTDDLCLYLDSTSHLIQTCPWDLHQLVL